MSYGIGIKALKRLCQEQSPVAWQKAKLSEVLFKPVDLPVYVWVRDHLKAHHALPQVETLVAQFPETAPAEVPEPPSYYVLALEEQYAYDRMSRAMLESQTLLKQDQAAYPLAMEVLRQCQQDITSQRHRARILDVGVDALTLVMNAYVQANNVEHVAAFGWPYMDGQSGGVMPGDVISFVGRPAVGKTWMTLYTALHNWRVRKLNVLFVSMEMSTLPITQRIAALYTHQNIGQLQMAQFSKPTFYKFFESLKGLTLEQAKMFVVDGNLATSAEELFDLAAILGCRVIVIDGAYLLRHKNARLDRFTRAAENVELIKRNVTDLDMMAFCSWQFNREASKKQKKGKGDHGDLEDIGYTDAIGQISSIALSLFQEDGIETMKARKIQIMKGRNGEIGQFSIAWDFTTMNFQQISPPIGPQSVAQESGDLQWV